MGMRDLGHEGLKNSQTDTMRFHVDRAGARWSGQAKSNFSSGAQALRGFGGSKETIKSMARLA